MSDTTGDTHSPVIIDLGKHKRSKIKKLRKGRGPILDDVATVMAELREEGVLAADAQPVVIIVREKTSKSPIERLFTMPG